jgi:hypothetical protein
MPAWSGVFKTPSGGCRFEKVWGHSIDKDIRKSKDGVIDWAHYEKIIFEDVYVWLYLNQGQPVSVLETADSYSVNFSHGAISSIDKASGKRLVTGPEGDVWINNKLSMRIFWGKDFDKILEYQSKTGECNNDISGLEAYEPQNSN